ncbi:MAG: efflux transporter outer membrane subunit [Gammaproteobacteria bacterium]|nr:efflux transporter outer membrane subunit [Gammaproteobacteria bacterium]
MKLAWCGVVLALGACSLAPPLERPASGVPENWKEASPAIEGQWTPADPADALSRGAWWEVFADPVLSALLRDATSANFDLAAAAARVEQSRTLVKTAAAAQLPRVDFGAGAAAGKSANVGPGLRGDPDLAPYDRYTFGAALSYEVDLFGRVRDSVRAADADFSGQQALYQSFLLALQAEVARTYFLIRLADAELAVLNTALHLRRDTLALDARRALAGEVSDVDLVRAVAELQALRTELIGVERTRAQDEHALAILLARAPAAFALTPAPLAATPPRVPPGLPSTLLERRPDIAAAERRMEAANARIGVAKAAFYPLLDLTADASFVADDIGKLFAWSARTWALGPLAGLLLVQPIFDGGRNAANLERAQAALREETALYRQQILNAVREVEDALVALRTLAEQHDTVANTLAAATRAQQLAQQRFDAGATSYLEVLQAQRLTLLVERQTQQISGARVLASVALIRALGGGW